MITATVDMTNFRNGMGALVRSAGVSSRTVVKKETGELIKTLVRVSPPSPFAKSKSREELHRNIAFDVNRKFRKVSDESLSRNALIGMHTKSGLLLTGANNRFLFASAPEADKSRTPVSELAKMRWGITKKGRQNVPFKHPRRQQRVLLSQTVTTTEGKIKKVIALAQRGEGRLKAGWLVAVDRGAVTLTGANQPPQWVRRHAAGAKGAFVDGTGTPDNPTFTITNRARGVGNKQVNGIVRMAIGIRAKAMQKNALLFSKGKKRLGDYK